MAWMTYTAAKPIAEKGTGLKVSLRKSQSPHKSAHMSLLLTPDLARQLGWCDLDMLKVELGTDEDHGQIRLTKNNSVGIAAVRKAKTSFRISLGQVPGYVNRKEEARHANFEVVSPAAIVVTLPLWAQETSPEALKKLPVAAPRGGGLTGSEEAHTPKKSFPLENSPKHTTAHASAPVHTVAAVPGLQEAANFRKPSRAVVK